MSTAPGPDGERHESPLPIPLHRHRLRLARPPKPLTPLLGRETELEAISALLTNVDVRLVTLVGPGGIGKTRLSLSVATRLEAAFDNQVAWVPVTTATTPEAVAAAIASSVGALESGNATTFESLKLTLRDANLLMVIDNFEQALDAGPVLTELLVDCPGISILVTSRALLRISGEHPFDLPPLAITVDATGSPVPPEIAPAVQLFSERAANVLPAFELTHVSVPIVTEICQRLDGLPLAIELAAARINHLSLPDLRDRLDRRLPLLTVAERGVPARHRTMRDAIAWSYDLLTEDQRSLFRSLAVFTGGFTVEALEAVATDQPDVLSALGVLVDNSLVQLESSSQTGTRYTMLETVREFAVEQLDASGDDLPGERHAEYFLELARRIERTFWGDEPGDVRGQVWAEEANLRTAVGWAIAHGHVEMAARLAIVMFDPLSHTGDNAREQYMWLQRALALPGGSPSARAFALTRSAGLVRLDELAEGAALAEQALALARQHDDEFFIAESLRVLGNIAVHTGESDRARSCLLEAVARFRDLGVRGRTGWTLHHLSALEGLGPEANPALAAAYCDEALAIFRDIDHPRGVQATLNWHSECAFKLGDLPTALASAKEGLAMIRSESWSYDYLDRIADVASAIGQPVTAARLYGAAHALRMRAARPIEPAFRAAHEARIETVRTALGSEAFVEAHATGQDLDQAVAEALSVEIPAGGASTRTIIPSTSLLTPRELEVVRLLAAGHSDRAIADTLFIGERTVNTHVAHVFAKLGVRNRAAAVTAAVAAGLVDPGSVAIDPAKAGQHDH